MTSIGFDNPYLLLIAIPLLLGILIPYFVTFRRVNRSKGVVASLILHVITIVLIAAAFAGLTLETVITKTEVWVVADVSYSSSENGDKIDEYINELDDKLPKNSKVGVIAFGKDCVTVTPMGEKFTSVKNSGVDDSATNLADAVKYAASLFDDGVIKRILLISDGKQSDRAADLEFISTVDGIIDEGIYIDAVYLDSNIKEDSSEVQISGVEFTGSTFRNHSAEASVVIQSGCNTDAIITLLSGDAVIDTSAVKLVKGFNYERFELPTDNVGVFDYKVKIEVEGDLSEKNNTYSFTQTVSGDLNVLLISYKKGDKEAAERLYGSTAKLDCYVQTRNVPYSIEELCKYDEIIISNISPEKINNFSALVENLDKVVSLFGKSLVTVGDMQIQNRTDETLERLSNMLPVVYGNGAGEPKLYSIVIDASRSMQLNSQRLIAEETARQLIDKEIIRPIDDVAVIFFSGDATVVRTVTNAGKGKDEIKATVTDISCTQGTFIGRGLEAALEYMRGLSYLDKRVVLLSDGMSFTNEPDSPIGKAAELLSEGIVTTVINTNCKDGEANLKAIASAGGGGYYFIRDEKDVESIVIDDIADEITESVVEGKVPVRVELPEDEVLGGAAYIPDIYGYVFATKKSSATTTLTVDYYRKSGAVVHVPLFSYWNYGNGRVSSLTTDISGDWVELWSGTEAENFLSGIVVEGVPEKNVDSPYVIDVNFDGTYSSVEVTPAVLNPFATTVITVTMPGGTVLTEELLYDGAKYYYSFLTPEIGRYTVLVSYSYPGFEAAEYTEYFNISYSPEFDRFVTFNSAVLNEAISSHGVVSEAGVPKLENNENEVATYKVTFAAAFMIACVIIFVVDVIVRKLTWKDIVSLFGKGVKEAKKK